MAGALPEAELVGLLEKLGFEDVTLSHRTACFAGTSAERKVSADLGIGGVTVRATKPR